MDHGLLASKLLAKHLLDVDLNNTGVGRRVLVGSEFAATLLDARAREARGRGWPVRPRRRT